MHPLNTRSTTPVGLQAKADSSRIAAVLPGRQGSHVGRGSLNSKRAACRKQVSVRAHATQKGRLTVLSAVSRAVEIQGLTARFERLAGRSAMLGTTTALFIEAFTEEGLFHGGGNELLLGGACVMALAGLVAALQSSNPLDLPVLLEPVLASLTATKRSAAAAVKDAQVDSVVDDVIQASFPASVLSALVVDAIIDDSKLI